MNLIDIIKEANLEMIEREPDDITLAGYSYVQSMDTSNLSIEEVIDKLQDFLSKIDGTDKHLLLVWTLYMCGKLADA